MIPPPASLVVVLSAVLFGAAALGHAEARRQVPADRQEIRLSFAPLVKRVAPAVVNIYAKRVVRTKPFSPFFSDPFFRRFFGDRFSFGGPRERVENSLGSGVVVRGHGLVVTNHHVIKEASSITVVLADRREFDARIVGTDERTDLAVLAVETGGETLPFLELRDSDDLEVGDLVLAIGNPFGVGQTVTSGIVSAAARTATGISDYSFFIQTDAAINPGNSGGALVSMDGSLVGINTAIYSRSGGSIGIGFAIPSNMVTAVVDAIDRTGRMVRPWLGVETQDIDSEIGATLGLARPTGAIVRDVWPGGPADRAGLRPGDVITAVDDKPVVDRAGLLFRIAMLRMGSKASFSVWRAGRQRVHPVDIAPAPEIPLRDTTRLRGRHPLSGASVANLSPAVAEELDLAPVRGGGVAIVGIREGSTAQRLNFRVGDVLVNIDGDAMRTVRELQARLAEPAEGWRIVIRRDGETISAAFGG